MISELTFLAISHLEKGESWPSSRLQEQILQFFDTPPRRKLSYWPVRLSDRLQESGFRSDQSAELIP